MLCRGGQIAHKPLANEVSQAACEVGWPGSIIRIIVEANRVPSPECNALTKVDEAERFGCCAMQDSAQAIGTMGPHDRRSDCAHAHANAGVLAWRGRVTNGVDFRVGDRAQKGINDNLIVFVYR